jgi:hypothetical protein
LSEFLGLVLDKKFDKRPRTPATDFAQLAFKRASKHLIGGKQVNVWDEQAWPACS